MHENEFYNFKVISNLIQFKQKTDVIIANRLAEEMNDVTDKIVSRDLFGNES